MQDLEGSLGAKSRPQPLTANTKALMHSQTGKAPLIRVKTGVVVDTLPFDRHIVRVRGSGGLTKRDRKLLRICIPAIESKLPHNQDIDVECEVDSAWGARGQMTQSADSKDDLGGGPTYSGTGSQDAAPPDSQIDSQEMELGNSLGGRDLETGQSDISNDPWEIGLRRSTEGKTSRFK